MAGMSERLRSIKREVRWKGVVNKHGLERLETEAEEAWLSIERFPCLSDEEVFWETVKYLLLQKQIYEVRSRWALDKTERENLESIAAQYGLVLGGSSLTQLSLDIVHFAQANANYLARKRNASHLARSWRNVCEGVVRLAGEKGWFVNS